MPILTGFLLLAMQSIVAGITEEAAFRGYMQSMIEERHGIVIAIVVNGVFFGLLHFSNHPADVLLMLPYQPVVGRSAPRRRMISKISLRGRLTKCELATC